MIDLSNLASLAKATTLDPKGVLADVACRHGLTVGRIRSKDRHRRVTLARAAVCNRLRAEPYKWSYPEIGLFLDLDHSSVMYLTRKYPRA